MNKNEVLDAAEKAVQNVESKLSEIAELSAEATRLESEISKQAQAEAEILASDKSDESKVKKLLEVRARRDVHVANLSKTKNNIGATEQEAIALGNRADYWLGAVRDALIVSRKARVMRELEATFSKRVLLELSGFVEFSLLVQEVESEGHGRFFWSAAQPEKSLNNCTKIRLLADHLIGLQNRSRKLKSSFPSLGSSR
jgi:hypothetical protein